MVLITGGEIVTENHLYILDTKTLEDTAVYESWYTKMPAARREKIDKLRFDKDKRLSLGAGILIHTGLTCAGIGGEEILYSEHGKPYLAGNDDVFFNVSHSGNLAVCAVSPRQVGVDVELVRKFDEPLKRHVFNTPPLSDAECTRLWTVKESVMKYFGTGISLGAKNIHVNMTEPITVTCEGYDTSGLYISSYAIYDAFVSVASGFAKFAAPEQVDPGTVI